MIKRDLNTYFTITLDIAVPTMPHTIISRIALKVTRTPITSITDIFAKFIPKLCVRSAFLKKERNISVKSSVFSIAPDNDVTMKEIIFVLSNLDIILNITPDKNPIKILGIRQSKKV